MARRTKEEAQKTRDRILDVALSIFYEKGFSRTTLEDIAEKAGFTRGAIYWHFKDKYQLFSVLSEEIERSTEIAFDKLDGIHAERLDDIERILVGYLTMLVKNKKYRMYYELTRFRTEWTDEMKPIIDRDRRHLRAIVDTLVRNLEDLKIKALLRDDLDTKRAAVTACAFIEGLIILWILDKKLFDLKKEAQLYVKEFMATLKP